GSECVQASGEGEAQEEMIDPNDTIAPDVEEEEPAGGQDEEPNLPAPSFQRLDLSLPEGIVNRAQLAIRLVGEIENYDRVTSRRRDASITWRQAYETMPPGTANRWDNSSDLPSSFTRTY